MGIPLLSFPHELQLKVLNSMDISSLAKTCRTNKELSSRAVPVLWRDIDFHWIYENEELQQEIEEVQRKFFVACDSMIGERPERWHVLAAYVRVLRFMKLPGSGISYEEGDGRGFNWSLLMADVAGRTIWEVIAGFSNLEDLRFYLKEQYDFDRNLDEIQEAMDGGFPRLKKLEAGGNVPSEVMLGLLSNPGNIEELACVILQDGSADQEKGTGGLLFLEPIQHEFTNLKVLTLSKMAELSEDHYGVMRLRWPFDRDNDHSVLAEWTEFLKRVSMTLVELTVEDRYLVNWREDRDINPGEGDPEDWTSASSERFREIMLPTIVDLEWPKLEKVVLIGMNVREKNTPNKDPLEHLQPRVQVEYRLGGLVRFNDDATPISVTPPNGHFSY